MFADTCFPAAAWWLNGAHLTSLWLSVLLVVVTLQRRALMVKYGDRLHCFYVALATRRQPEQDLIQVHLSSAIVTMQTTMDAQGVAYLIRQLTVLQASAGSGWRWRSSAARSMIPGCVRRYDIAWRSGLEDLDQLISFVQCDDAFAGASGKCIAHFCPCDVSDTDDVSGSRSHYRSERAFAARAKDRAGAVSRRLRASNGSKASV